MENDYLFNIYKIYYTNQNEVTRKFRKLMTSLIVSKPRFSSKNGNNYYISMNFKIL